MANIDQLKEKLVEEAASISDDVNRYDCLAAIDDWFLARTALSALRSNGVASYAIAGRSVTRRDLPQLERVERELYQQIRAFLGRGGAILLNMRGVMDEGRTFR